MNDTVKQAGGPGGFRGPTDIQALLMKLLVRLGLIGAGTSAAGAGVGALTAGEGNRLEGALAGGLSAIPSGMAGMAIGGGPYGRHSGIAGLLGALGGSAGAGALAGKAKDMISESDLDKESAYCAGFIVKCAEFDIDGADILEKEGVSPEWILKGLKSALQTSQAADKHDRIIKILRKMAVKKQITPVGVGTTDKQLLNRLAGGEYGLHVRGRDLVNGPIDPLQTAGQAAKSKAARGGAATRRLNTEYGKNIAMNESPMPRLDERAMPMDEYFGNLLKGILPR